MSGQIGESKINEVRERTDIIELVSQYVTLKRSGANHTGLCPFHSEKSPSFSVHAGRQFYHCFGCGVGGDVFSFLMKIEGLAFPDAVRRLAERAGIELEERQLSPQEERRRQQRERLYRVNELAAAYFHQVLMDRPVGEVGRQYLKQRGYGRKAAGEYQLGYALEEWEALGRYLQQQQVNVEDARTLGLIRPREQADGDYDLFRGRLMFPIYDLSGRVVAFGGRVLNDGKPKYINSPESPIYHKGRVLFGLYQARQAMRQSGEVILVEGYFDQLALYRAGFPQVVATCGTALTGEHARLLKRYVQRVLLLFDQDAAGRQATFKAMVALQEEGVPAQVIELPSGEDPDSFMRDQGAEAFKFRLDQARPVMDLFMEDALAAADGGIEQKVQAAKEVIERVAGLTNNMEQDLYLKDLARRSGIDLELLKQTLAETLQQPVSGPADYRGTPPEPFFSQPDFPESPVAPLRPGWSRPEEMVLCLLLHSEDARNQISAAGLQDYFFAPAALEVAELLLRESAAPETFKELIVAKLDSDLSGLVMPLLHKDPEQFAGEVEALLQDCKVSLQRELKKKQREETLHKIRQAELAGHLGPEDLVDQFKKLK